MEPLITSEQLAVHLALAPWTIRRMTRDKDIPSIKVGSAVRYRLSDVMGFLESDGQQKARG